MVTTDDSHYYDPETGVTVPASLLKLVEWYLDYAKEVIVDRAIIGIDGFKPVNRRLLYSMFKDKKKFDNWTKKITSVTTVGSTSSYHPHSDEAIYLALVRMADLSQYQNTPFIEAKGNWGKSYSKGAPASKRYTTMKPNDLAIAIFKELGLADMKLTESGEDYEPILLPTQFPNFLMNANSGIAVGMASNIIPLNFHEVIEGALEIIETGRLTKILAPDFPTGGEYVYNEAELLRLRRTGKGSFKLRGRWRQEGNKIIITEIPFYTMVQTVLKQIEKAEIPNLTAAEDFSDRLNPLRIEITVNRKANVPTVLAHLLRYTDLQMTVGANTVVIVDESPKEAGVETLLNDWISYREKLVEKSLKQEYESVLTSIPRYELLVDLFKNPEKRSTLIKTIAEQNISAGKSYLRELYPDTTQDVIEWVVDRKLTSLSGLATRESRLVELYARKEELENDLSNIRGVISRELRELNSTLSFPRKTEVSTVDYQTEEKEVEEIKTAPTPVLVKIDGKYVKKLNAQLYNRAEAGVWCWSNDVISFIDNSGRLIRLSLDTVPLVSETERGIYLSSHLEIEDDYELVAYNLIEDKTVGYLYNDGFASVLDLSEWYGAKRITRITQNGVSEHASKICGEIDFSKEYIFVMTKSKKFGFAPTNFKFKQRIARTKAVHVEADDPIEFAIPISYNDVIALVSNPERYIGKVSAVHRNDTFNLALYNELVQRNA